MTGSEERKMAALKIQSQGLVIIIVVLVASFLLVAPLSPVITFNFEVSVFPSYQITMTNVGYQKQQLGATLSVPKGVVGLNELSPQQGTLVLEIIITYRGDPVADNIFSSKGAGAYQGKLVLWPRSEDASTPYLITILLMQNQQVVAQTTAQVLPT